MYKIVKGDLLALTDAGEFDIIVHGCNCQNVMGSGIAKQIREKYPKAWEADCNYHTENPIDKLGNYTYSLEENFMVVNAYTQVHYLPRGVDHFEYASFAMILQKLAVKHGKRRFGFPMIGMGLAGGNRDSILALLYDFTCEVHSQGGEVTIVEYEQA